jgi:hypothetical protein
MLQLSSGLRWAVNESSLVCNAHAGNRVLGCLRLRTAAEALKSVRNHVETRSGVTGHLLQRMIDLDRFAALFADKGIHRVKPGKGKEAPQCGHVALVMISASGTQSSPTSSDSRGRVLVGIRGIAPSLAALWTRV